MSEWFRNLLRPWREPFAGGGLVVFLTLVIHFGRLPGWTAPIAIVGLALSVVADELWQRHLDAPKDTP